jgi:hypothetical protein
LLGAIWDKDHADDHAATSGCYRRASRRQACTEAGNMIREIITAIAESFPGPDERLADALNKVERFIDLTDFEKLEPRERVNLLCRLVEIRRLIDSRLVAVGVDADDTEAEWKLIKSQLLSK